MLGIIVFATAVAYTLVNAYQTVKSGPDTTCIVINILLLVIGLVMMK